jgi:hypothetical protein
MLGTVRRPFSRFWQSRFFGINGFEVLDEWKFLTVTEALGFPSLNN